MAVRWCYKTVLFNLTKDGLLGGSFLDDQEIEETLNEYGQAGWELMSMVDVRDGMLAIYKQPIEGRSFRKTESGLVSTGSELKRTRPATLDDLGPENAFDDQGEDDRLVVEPELVAEEVDADGFEEAEDEPRLFGQEEVDESDNDSDSSVGSIRIE